MAVNYNGENLRQLPLFAFERRLLLGGEASVFTTRFASSSVKNLPTMQVY